MRTRMMGDVRTSKLRETAPKASCPLTRTLPLPTEILELKVLAVMQIRHLHAIPAVAIRSSDTSSACPKGRCGKTPTVTYKAEPQTLISIIKKQKGRALV